MIRNEGLVPLTTAERRAGQVVGPGSDSDRCSGSGMGSDRR